MFLTIETASEPLLLSSMDVCMEAPLLWRYDDESRVYETVSSMPRESLSLIHISEPTRPY